MNFRARSGAAGMRSAELTSFKQSSSTPLPRRSAAIRTFRSMVRRYWKEQGRHNLPWRKTRDPYKILVSEIMLQQTQADRVIPYYKDFLRKFPTARHLARSHLATVLRMWSGLGYNRRAKYLRDAAVEIAEKHSGRVPRDYKSLRALPGVGDYIARAVRVFAFNEPDVLIETNIRTAFIHTFFTGNASVTDQELVTLLSKVTDTRKPREWHWALMDYGAHLKKNGVRNNRKSAHYIKQSKFEGSLRQVRGAILKALSRGEHIKGLRNPYIGRFDKALASLARDKLILHRGRKWRIA